MAILFIAITVSCGGTDPVAPPPEPPVVDNTITLKGNIAADLTIPADSSVVLSGEVRVVDGVTLTIGAGTVVKSRPSSTEVDLLVIMPGAKLIAIGTEAKPIKFTSGKPVGFRTTEDWGGIQFAGRATIPEGNALMEGVDVYYGGVVDNDDSGHLKYVIVEFAGRNITPEKQLNGIALFGVGSETIIEYIHLHMCGDDGIEPFGGTVNLNRVMATACGDDQIDVAPGWRGWMSNCISIGFAGNSGFEMDGDITGAVQTLANMYHCIGLHNYSTGSEDNYSFRMRRGGTFNWYDSVLIGNAPRFLRDGYDAGTDPSASVTTINFNNCVIQGVHDAVNNLNYATTTHFTNLTATRHDLTITGGTVETTATPNFALITDYDQIANHPLFNDARWSWAKGWTSFPAN